MTATSASYWMLGSSSSVASLLSGNSLLELGQVLRELREVVAVRLFDPAQRPGAAIADLDLGFPDGDLELECRRFLARLGLRSRAEFSSSIASLMNPPCMSRKNTRIVIMSIIDVRLISALLMPLVQTGLSRAASYDLHRVALVLGLD